MRCMLAARFLDSHGGRLSVQRRAAAPNRPLRSRRYADRFDRADPQLGALCVRETRPRMPARQRVDWPGSASRCSPCSADTPRDAADQAALIAAYREYQLANHDRLIRCYDDVVDTVAMLSCERPRARHRDQQIRSAGHARPGARRARAVHGHRGWLRFVHPTQARSRTRTNSTAPPRLRS